MSGTYSMVCVKFQALKDLSLGLNKGFGTVDTQ